MNFLNLKYLPLIALIGISFVLIMRRSNQKYFKWIKTYWFFEQSVTNKIANFFYFLSFLLMIASLLDLRGPEEKIQSNLPDQKTVIILDSSSSMLAEDVRPSRFKKGIQLARHFVKSAAGHQVSIVLFSDIQKRLIPFTDDVDLLDARLAALEKTNSVSGGSNISQAIAEAMGYFELEGGKKGGKGNILVFTDAEESEGAFDLELGTDVNLAVVGIGTAKGAPIPLRWEDGTFRGYKMQKNEQVITKLDEDYIKKIGKGVASYKYWIANSYALPTEEVLNFFRSSYNKSNNKGDMRVRPVYSHLLLIPAIFCYILSVFLGRFLNFKMASFLFFIALFSWIPNNAKAYNEKPPEKKMPAWLKNDLEKMKEGKKNRQEVLKIAEALLKNNEEIKANEIYTEYKKPEDPWEVRFNHATSLLKGKKIPEAIPLVEDILKNSKDENLNSKMRNNLLLALAEEEKDKGKGKSEDKKDDKKENKNENKNEDNKNQNQNNDKGEDKKENKKNKESGKEKENKENKENKEDNEKETREPRTLQEKEKEIEQKRKMVKTPAMIKQILSDDRELQKKMMDTSTSERSSKTKRDW